MTLPEFMRTATIQITTVDDVTTVRVWEATEMSDAAGVPRRVASTQTTGPVPVGNIELHALLRLVARELMQAWIRRDELERMK